MEDVKMTAKSTTLILQCFRSAFCPDAVMYVGSRHECMQRQLTETELTCGWSERAEEGFFRGNRKGLGARSLCILVTSIFTCGYGMPRYVHV